MSEIYRDEADRSERFMRMCLDAGDVMCAEYYADRAKRYRELAEEHDKALGRKRSRWDW